jgi:hypothetical protein
MIKQQAPETNYGDLTEDAEVFAVSLINLEFSNNQIYGIFFIIGAQTVLNYTQDDLDKNRKVSALLGPHDHNINLDEQVGDYFETQEHLLEEFIYRMGWDLDYRSIEIEGLAPRQLFTPSNHGLMPKVTKTPEKLSDCHHIYLALFERLGQRIRHTEIGLREAFMCGLFQSQILLDIDQKAMVQLLKMTQALMSPLIGSLNSFAINATPKSTANYLHEQIALMGLWPCRSDELFMSVAWPFQSWIFFKDGNVIDGIDQLSPTEFWNHCFVKGKELVQSEFDNVPKLSETSIVLDNLPTWGSSDFTFENIDNLIEEWTGCGSQNIKHYTDKLHYRAFVVHYIYSSIAKARETYN